MALSKKAKELLEEVFSQYEKDVFGGKEQYLSKEDRLELHATMEHNFFDELLEGLRLSNLQEMKEKALKLPTR